jgi:hypothetical protein
VTFQFGLARKDESAERFSFSPELGKNRFEQTDDEVFSGSF